MNYAEALKSYPAKSFDAIASDMGVDKRTIIRHAKLLGIKTAARDRRPRRPKKRAVFAGALVTFPELCLWMLGN